MSSPERLRNIPERVKGIVAAQLRVENVELSSDIYDNLGGDSLDILEIILDLEDEIGVCIDDSEIRKVRTVGDLARMVEEASKG